jgi:hypothetical protein
MSCRTIALSSIVLAYGELEARSREFARIDGTMQAMASCHDFYPSVPKHTAGEWKDPLTKELTRLNLSAHREDRRSCQFSFFNLEYTLSFNETYTSSINFFDLTLCLTETDWHKRKSICRRCRGRDMPSDACSKLKL